MRQYCRKVLAKSEGFEKNIKMEGWPYRGVAYRRGVSNLLHTMSKKVFKVTYLLCVLNSVFLVTLMNTV